MNCFNIRVILIFSFILMFNHTVLASGSNDLAVSKVKGKLSVMVLGSGGPIAATSGRASSGYLIFVEGKPRILMDMGGGTFKSLAQSGSKIPEINRVLLTHLHLDHTADMSAIVKTVFFHNLEAGRFRTIPFHFYGPASNNSFFPLALTGGEKILQYPTSSDYVHGHYNIKTGVERYLNIFSRGIKAGVLNYTATDLPSDFTSNTITTVFEDSDGLKVSSIAVNHGPVPAVAYRIEYAGSSIVWSGDTSSKTNNMIRLANDADILIYDTALMADDPPPDSIFHKLHTLPARLAEVAVIANPARLVLSHITPVTGPRINEIKTIIRDAGYSGKIHVAKDLKVYNIAD